MLRYCLVLAASLLVVETASASWADKMFDELSKDFGSVPRGPMLKHYFRVTNNTKEPVTIASVRVSCGCTSATAIKTYLKPGEETHIYATMDTTRFSGPKTVTIFVQLSSPSFEEVRLWVQANGRDDFAVGPDTLEMGQVRRGTSPNAAVVVTFYGMSPDTKITEIKAESNYIKTELKPVKTDGGQVAFQLKASLRADTPVGKWYSDVWLKTNNPSIPQIRVPLTVEIESALSVSPDLVSIGQVKVNSENERRVVIRGAQPFKVTEIDGADDMLIVKDNTEEAKTVHVLTVKIKPPTTGEIKRKIKVKTDLKEENEIDFQVTATILP